ncbi:dihydrodipicolinate synthase family protein [Bradyrhizobium sp. BR 1433]|uniref:dihydrodipicolinate synthase family protein n=1 Tax=Bradyrhizobium sp. BR 1433 TaxID=3447967 RepID=UPI003EE77346
MTLSDTEWDIVVIRAAVEIAREGAPGSSRALGRTPPTGLLNQRAQAAGADAVLSVVPFFNKPIRNGHAHFAPSPTQLDCPHPARPACADRELADDTLVRLAESEQFVRLKDGTVDVVPTPA